MGVSRDDMKAKRLPAMLLSWHTGSGFKHVTLEPHDVAYRREEAHKR
jgi:hypothetical protein